VFGATNEERNVKLQHVVVTKANDAETTYPATLSTGTLCVLFRD
jgi:hypothetical protein